MNTLNILVVSADRSLLDALTAIVSRTNRFVSCVMQDPDAQRAIKRIGERIDLFDVVIATNDDETDPRRLVEFLEKHDRLDSFLVVQTSAIEPLAHCDFVAVGPNMITRLLNNVRTIAISRQHS